MTSSSWFILPYRDNSFRKYRIEISKLIKSPRGAQFDEISVRVYEEDNCISSFRIKFTHEWINNINELNDFEQFLGNESYSPLVAGVVQDYIHARKLEELNEETICFHASSEYSNRVFRNENGMLNYDRDPVKIAEENRFARELVLRELYFIHSGRGPSHSNYIIGKCNYYSQAVRNAIDVLKSRKFILDDMGNTLKLSYEGFAFVEDKLLSPFSDKIFLIAACYDDIYHLYRKVYKPAVTDLGYDLVFQERSEPKNSIHDEIWENIENCKLIICDLTHKRPNCFIEYGYALAKGKQIILCVEESEGKSKNRLMKVPFDTQTQKYSFWRKEWLNDNDLLNKFRNEIRNRVEMKLKILDSRSEI